MSKKLSLITAVSMTSFEISELVGKRHDSVKRTIDFLVKKGVITLPHHVETPFKDKNGKGQKRAVYVFEGEKGKRDCFVLVAQLSPEFTAAVVDRWQYLEKRESDKVARVEERKDSKQLYRHMTDVIKDVRSEEGKETKFWHYSNEADMINRIIFGMSAKEFREFHNVKPDAAIRDMMTKLELEAINRLQNVNESLYQCGFDLKTRREKLESIFDKYFNKRMEKERLRIDA